jgi:N6-adenosine-specific RNA methylase IME4
MNHHQRYRTIVADPPWPYRDVAGSWRRGESFAPYESLSLEEIAALPVGALAAPGAHLYLWTTNRFLWDAPDIFRAWGFTPATTITWCKEPMGQAGGSEAFANSSEFIVWGRKRFGSAIRRAREELGITQAELERRVRGGVQTGLAARWEEDSSWPNPEHLDGLSIALGWDVDDYAAAPSKRWDTTWFSWKRGAHSQKPEAFLDLVEQTSPWPYLELFARRQRLGWDTWGDEALEHVEMAGSGIS